MIEISPPPFEYCINCGIKSTFVFYVKKLNENQRAATEKPVSEMMRSSFISHQMIEKLKLLHLIDQVSRGGGVDPVAGLLMHFGTNGGRGLGGKSDKLPMSLHPTTPSW